MIPIAVKIVIIVATSSTVPGLLDLHGNRFPVLGGLPIQGANAVYSILLPVATHLLLRLTRSAYYVLTMSLDNL